MFILRASSLPSQARDKYNSCLIKHKKAFSAGTEPTAFYRHSGGTHEEVLSVQLDDRPNDPLKVRKRAFCDAILY